MTTTFSIDTDRILQLEKQLQLAKFLDCLPSELESDCDESTFNYGRATYRVLTDSEADEACAESIEQSLWAFNADFLSGYTKLDSRVFSALSELCEDANDAVRALIDGSGGFDNFVSEAVGADGRGHFMSSYDGEEWGYGGYYIYRTN